MSAYFNVPRIPIQTSALNGRIALGINTTAAVIDRCSIVTRGKANNADVCHSVGGVAIARYENAQRGVTPLTYRNTLADGII